MLENHLFLAVRRGWIGHRDGHLARHGRLGRFMGGEIGRDREFFLFDLDENQPAPLRARIAGRTAISLGAV